MENCLFTGDHLAYSLDDDDLTGFKIFNHGSIEAQHKSILRLADPKYDFQWILPSESYYLL
jgi:hypothetical protein